MNKYKGLKRKALKKRWDKIKNMQRNNLKTGLRYAIESLNDLRMATLKSKTK